MGFESSPAGIPLYDHSNLEVCLRLLTTTFGAIFEMVVPTNCVSIKLEQRDKYFWEGDLPDSRYFGNSRWYFSISANVGEANLIMLILQLAKVCSARFVPELVRRSFSGMPS